MFLGIHLLFTSLSPIHLFSHAFVLLISLVSLSLFLLSCLFFSRFTQSSSLLASHYHSSFSSFSFTTSFSPLLLFAFSSSLHFLFLLLTFLCFLHFPLFFSFPRTLHSSSPNFLLFILLLTFLFPPPTILLSHASFLFSIFSFSPLLHLPLLSITSPVSFCFPRSHFSFISLFSLSHTDFFLTIPFVLAPPASADPPRRLRYNKHTWEAIHTSIPSPVSEE